MKTNCYLILNKKGVVGTRKTKPALSSGQVAIRLRINVSDRFFDRFIPEANLVVPDEMVMEPDIVVELDTPPMQTDADAG